MIIFIVQYFHEFFFLFIENQFLPKYGNLKAVLSVKMIF